MSGKKTRPLYFVTGNLKKLEELKLMVGPNFPFEIVNCSIDLPELQAEMDEITIKKCQEAACRLNQPVLIEDTSLGFNALNGLPGPYIKWFLDKLGPQGLYRMLHGWEDKSAEATCSYAYCEGSCDDDDIILFKGVTKGNIVKPRGDATDGRWDTIFQPEGFDQTYGELPPSVKHAISQNFKAAQKLKKYLYQRYDVSSSSESLIPKLK